MGSSGAQQGQPSPSSSSLLRSVWFTSRCFLLLGHFEKKVGSWLYCRLRWHMNHRPLGGCLTVSGWGCFLRGMGKATHWGQASISSYLFHPLPASSHVCLFQQRQSSSAGDVLRLFLWFCVSAFHCRAASLHILTQSAKGVIEMVFSVSLCTLPPLLHTFLYLCASVGVYA